MTSLPTEPTPPLDPEALLARTKEELVLGYRLFGALRWGDLGDGHITARDPERPDHFWLLRYPVSFDRATIDDLVLIGPDGSVVEGEGPYNRTAHRIHWPIHEARPDVTAAAHIHTPWGTPFAAERRPIDPISQESCAYFEDHALFDDEEVQVLSVDGGVRIAAALGSNRTVILANHGLLTTGAGVAEAVGAFVMLERVCEVQMKASAAKVLSAAGARRARDGLGLPGAFSEGFRFLAMRHLGEDPGPSPF